MDAIKVLVAPLKKLEKQAKKALTASAAAGRFDEVVTLAQFTKELSEFATRWSLAQRADNLAAAPPSAARPNTIQNTRVKKSEYPTFVREKDDLVKIGWSARERKPYEHRVPKDVVNDVVLAVMSSGKSGHRFTMDEVSKAIAQINGRGEVPSYQAYAAILWLKWCGMLLQHGRQGYTVVRPQTFDNSVETAWKSLPRR
jgi:hypothetical protein